MKTAYLNLLSNNNMLPHVILLIQIDKPQVFMLENFDLEDKVLILRECASQLTGLFEHQLALIYKGKALLDGCTVASYGIESGATINVVIRDLPNPTSLTEKLVNEYEFQTYVHQFERLRAITYRSDFCQPFYINKVIDRVPDLLKDPIAISLIQEMLFIFYQPNMLRRFLAAHPILGEVIPYIIKILNRKYPEPGTNQFENNCRSLTFWADKNKPAEEMNVTKEAVPDFRTVIDTQLATALDNAVASFAMNRNVDHLVLGRNTVITVDMVDDALDYAFDSLTPCVPIQGTLVLETTDMRVMWEQLFPKMILLREMGFYNNAENFRALQQTSGSLSAAMELLYKNNQF